MKFLIDTCVVSDFLRGDPAVTSRIKASSPLDLAASVVTEMEVLFGLRVKPRLFLRWRHLLNDLFDSIAVLPYDRAAGAATASLRASLRKRGTPIGAYDALIAGTALAHKLILVTSNVGEFRRVDRLELENWRDV